MQHGVLTYDLVVGGVAAMVAVGWACYRLGIWKSSKRISFRLKNDREFGIAILDELAGRWGVKVERIEPPGGV